MLGLLLLGLPVLASARAGVLVVITKEDGKVAFAQGIEVNHRTMVPLRSIADGLFATVQKDGPVISIRRGGQTVVVVVGSRSATVNGNQTSLDQPAIIRNRKTYVPLRFVSEAFDGRVEVKSGRVFIDFRAYTNESPAGPLPPGPGGGVETPPPPAPTMMQQVAILPIRFTGGVTDGAKGVAKSDLNDAFGRLGWSLSPQSAVRQACLAVYGRIDPESVDDFMPTGAELLRISELLNVRFVLFVTEEYRIRDAKVECVAKVVFIDAQAGIEKHFADPIERSVGKAYGPVDPACRDAARQLTSAMMAEMRDWVGTNTEIKQ